MSDDWYLIGRVALAALLGGLIGWERAVRGHSAGDRTFALLALGAAAFAAVASDTGDVSAVSRTVQGIAAGVGFIGAAVTWRTPRPGDTKGLTTAAAVWAVVAMGALCGVGKLALALAVAAIVLVLLELRHIPLLRLADPRRQRARYHDQDEQDS